MGTALEKGNALEQAVRIIERHILESSPNLAQNTFNIEAKKIINVNGVRHEIDVFVTIDPAPGYKSTFIFECKNWAEAVGKNEIIIFSEKIDAAGAQHGYFVAKSFTRDAEAQATHDRRMTLITATEHDHSALPILANNVAMALTPLGYHIGFRYWGTTGPAPGVPTEGVPLDLRSTRAKINGEDVDIEKYSQEWALQISQIPNEELADGSHNRTLSETRTFKEGSSS